MARVDKLIGQGEMPPGKCWNQPGRHMRMIGHAGAKLISLSDLTSSMTTKKDGGLEI
jgi:hypothetical protein